MEFKYKDIVFNNKLVLNKGCIEFNKGQITIITGESGSGKTTLFRLMTKGNDGWKDLDLYQNVSFTTFWRRTKKSSIFIVYG